MVQSKRQEIKAKIEKRLKEIENTIGRYLDKERIQLLKDETNATFLNLQSLYEFETSIPKPSVFLEEQEKSSK